MKTIGIIGTRRRDSEEDFLLVKEVFLKIYEDLDVICSGLCPQGGDWFAVLLSLGKDYVHDPVERKRILNKVHEGSIRYVRPCQWFPADWPKYGKGAGFIRNRYIAEESHILIACVAEDRKGGTEDTIRKFRKKLRFTDSKLILV